MVKEVKHQGFLKQLKKILRSSLFIPILLLLFVAITAPITFLVVREQQDLRQQAAQGSLTATMNLVPGEYSVSLDQQFSVSLVINGGGQEFNAAQADVIVSSNLVVDSLTITPPENGGCNFVFVNSNKTPKTSDPSFAGAILRNSTQYCTLYTMVLKGIGPGLGSINLNRPQVKSRTTHGDILLSYQNGNYTILGNITPTQVPPTPTPTTVIPTQTPTPTLPAPSPTTVVVSQPTINSVPEATFDSQIVLSGTKSSQTPVVSINNSSVGVIYPTNTTWQFAGTLSNGLNTFAIRAHDNLGNISLPVNASITLRKLGDISGDDRVDITDLSQFATDWENTGTLNYYLSDINNDLEVNLTDFSILASVYED